jgi:hypothetical protein
MRVIQREFQNAFGEAFDPTDLRDLPPLYRNCVCPGSGTWMSVAPENVDETGAYPIGLTRPRNWSEACSVVIDPCCRRKDLNPHGLIAH